MKKLLAMVLLAVFCVSLPAVAQQPNYSEKEKKQFAKQAEKEAKDAVKKLEKQKWTYSGAGSLQKAYERYLLASSDFGGVGTIEVYEINNAPNLRNGEKSLMNQAQAMYAQENEAFLKGEQTSHSGNTDITLDDNVVKMLAQFSGDVHRQFTVYKKNSDGTYDMRGFFVIDGQQTRAKLRRLAKDLDNELELSKKIKDNVNVDDK